ncbi:delta DNA polymerase, partial [Syncephalastrum racemosum]
MATKSSFGRITRSKSKAKLKTGGQLDLSPSPYAPNLLLRKRQHTAAHIVRESELFDAELKALTEKSAIEEAKARQTAETPWHRPKVVLDPTKNSLVFQVVDIDTHLDPVTQKATVLLYGTTREGNSVVCRANGFYSYFFFPIDADMDQSHLDEMRAIICIDLKMSDVIHAMEIVERKNLCAYSGDSKLRYVKMSSSSPKHLHRLRNKVQNGIHLRDRFFKALATFESNLAHELKFMVECKIKGHSWVELPAQKYEISKEITTHAQIEASIQYTDLIAHAPEEASWMGIAPLRILSFDIECMVRANQMCDPEVDSVIQIATVVKLHGEKTQLIRNVFTLNSCAAIPDAQVLSFYSESDMLQAWKDFFIQIDPDIVTGYNFLNFDFPYLIRRAKKLGIEGFPYFGRAKNIETKITKADDVLSSAGRVYKQETVVLTGRLEMDVIRILRREIKMSRYSLNEASKFILGKNKDDVHFSEISKLHKGNADSRRRLAQYCLKDAILPLEIMEKLTMVSNYTQMSRVAGVPIRRLLASGQRMRIVTQLQHYATAQGFIIPMIENQDYTDIHREPTEVISPARGLYEGPVVRLDIRSLYSSIIQAYNLCYTTVISDKNVKQLDLLEDKDFITTLNGVKILTPGKRRGILPQLLADLFAEESRMKQEHEREKDTCRLAALKSRENALKTSANSVYGFLKASKIGLTSRDILSSIDCLGSDILLRARQVIEGHFRNSKVIYGDTDSLMVLFNVEDVNEAITLGHEACRLITRQFKLPVHLAVDKVYMPFLLTGRKNYAGVPWIHSGKHGELYVHGYEDFRQDFCKLRHITIRKCIEKILVDRDVEGAKTYVMQTISDLLNNRTDASWLILSKALIKNDQKSRSEYNKLLSHMRARNPRAISNFGDRISYIMVQTSRSDPYAEEPLFVAENDIPVNTSYYIERQLRKPLGQLFESIGSNISKLFDGDHTRSVAVTTRPIGPLGKFTVKKSRCIGCRANLDSKDGEDDPALCQHCRPNAVDIILKESEKLNDAEIRFSRLWTQCQQCQSTIHQQVECGNIDCDIFYMRFQARKDLEDASARNDRLAKLDLDW